jgi:UDP-N-acetylglucosamine 1-carboxyvinyltransferase
MDQYIVEPSGPLFGEVKISGAKNAVLPIMAATLLARGVSRISNVPNLKDVRTMSDVLRVIGARVEFKDGVLEIDTTNADHLEAPYELVKTMRASIYVMGPLLALHGEVRVSLPGGCAWGPRPVDLHLKGMEKLGAQMSMDHGYIIAKAPNKRLKGAEYHFPISSVGATANVLMAAVLAEGKTILQNAAVEPEIDNLADFLNTMGAKISGIGTRTLVIEGVESVQPGNWHTIPDRIEAGTFLAGAAITRGRVTVTNVDAKHLENVLDSFKEMGCDITIDGTNITLDAENKTLKPVNVETQPYPGFPTDMQAQMMALLCTVPGTSVVADTIYHDRFKHVMELDRLGAHISLRDHVATISGGHPFTCAPVMASDLRASAALVLAGLVADGKTKVSRIYHMDRGYEAFEKKLAGLGGLVTRVKEQSEEE